MLGLATTLSAAGKTIKVKATNPSHKARSAVPIVIKLDGETSQAVVKRGDYEIPCQLDDLNDDGINDELSFVTDMAANETQEFSVTLSPDGVPRTYYNRTYGYIGIRDRSEKKQKHQRINSVTFPKGTNPYNYIYPHGAVMENDMIGFRVYCDHRQSIDLYGHRHRKNSNAFKATARMCSIQAAHTDAEHCTDGTARTPLCSRMSATLRKR